ncbi:MAG: hypothetical protein ABR583_06210 [Gaiellaceae bacterium]
MTAEFVGEIGVVVDALPRREVVGAVPVTRLFARERVEVDAARCISGIG